MNHFEGVEKLASDALLRNMNLTKKANKREEAHRIAAHHGRLNNFTKAIPLRYRSAKRGDFSERVATKVKNWCESSEWCLLIQGKENGTGKTHLAFAAMRLCMFIDSERKVIYHSSANAFIRWLQQDYQGKTNHIKEAIECDLLLIDDLCKERFSDDVSSLMIEIIHDRYFNERKTIITTNKSLDDIKEKFDNSIKSRLFESRSIILRGEDRRAR